MADICGTLGGLCTCTVHKVEIGSTISKQCWLQVDVALFFLNISFLVMRNSIVSFVFACL